MNRRHVFLILLAPALCACGCGKSSQPPARTSPPPAGTGSTAASGDSHSTAPSQSGESTPTNESESSGTPIEGPTGSIEGTVTFVGDEIPESTVVSNTTDPQICGAALSKRDKEISPDTRGVRYVLVWLENVKLPVGYQPPTQNLILDNTKCQFEPHAAAITVGSTIETRNSDEVYHTTNLLGTKGFKENIPLVAKGASHQTKVRTAELINVKCDKHGWMQAFIRVDPHPFHAVTDADGKFSIAGVPAGTYKLKTWHEFFFMQEFEVTIQENETATLEVKYPVAEEK